MERPNYNSHDATQKAQIQAQRGGSVPPPVSNSSSPLYCRSAPREMAAVLSRALKLPGKKGSELGEYDPLTQADSEDESEEDDLVLNYPRNGLGRDAYHGGGSTKLRGGRVGRLVAAGDSAQEDDDDWRERLPSKCQQDRDDVKGGPYWSPSREDREQCGGSGLRIHGTEEEEKRLRRKNAMRASFFLVPLVCAMLLVLLCAFLIPCQKGALAKRPKWEKALGDAGGVTPPALALWDVDGDSVDDVLLSVTEWTNDTHPTQGNKIYSAVALSGASGQLLWRKVIRESVLYIQCGLQLNTKPLAVCLLIGKSSIMAVNGTSGKNLWSALLRNIESQAVLLPDVQGDSVPDLLVATLPADEALDLSLTLISGLTGAKLGQSVSFNLTGQGKLIGPLLHETQQGAHYIVFGLGNVVAISLRDIYVRANSKLPVIPALRRKDPRWEGLKKTNSSSFIHIFRGSESVEFLLPLVAGFGTYHNNLDTVSNLNTSKSDWVLVYGFSKISVLGQKDVRKRWTFNSAPIHSQPTPGHFNEDGILDLFFQHSANGIMKAQVIDGANGRPLWTAQFVCPRLVLETAAVSTSTGLSTFVFWASEPIGAQMNITKATVSLEHTGGPPGCCGSRAGHQKAVPVASCLSLDPDAARHDHRYHSGCFAVPIYWRWVALFSSHPQRGSALLSCRIQTLFIMASALSRLGWVSAVTNVFASPAKTATACRTAACSSSGAILPKPKKTPFGLWRIAAVVVPFLYVGTRISKSFAELLEEHDIFVPEDDDDDD